jgi:hypothetical protein
METKVSSTKREWPADLAVTSAIALLAGAVIGLLGPFGTYSFALSNRLVYWIAIIGINWLLCAVTLREIERLFPPDRIYSLIAVPLLTSLVLVVPATAVVFSVGRLIEPALTPNIVPLLGMVFLLLVVLATPGYVIRRLIRQRHEPGIKPRDSRESAVTPDNESTFFARFTPPIRGPITSIESQDHYLVVRGPEDRRMIHCRMNDAQRELGAVGIRVHRSWWVAKDAIERRLRRNGRHYLELTDGQLIPISRAYLPSLDERNRG